MLTQYISQGWRSNCAEHRSAAMSSPPSPTMCATASRQNGFKMLQPKRKKSGCPLTSSRNDFC